VVVHAHSRLVSVTDDNSTDTVSASRLGGGADDGLVLEPDVPFWLFCLHR